MVKSEPTLETKLDSISQCQTCGYEWLTKNKHDAEHSCVDYLKDQLINVQQEMEDRWWFEITVDRVIPKEADPRGWHTFHVNVYEKMNRSGFPNITISVVALDKRNARNMVMRAIFDRINSLPKKLERGS